MSVMGVQNNSLDTGVGGCCDLYPVFFFGNLFNFERH